MPMDSGRKQRGVVAIECVAGGSRAEEWGPGCSETVQTGDVVEELLIGVGGRGGAIAHAAPFKGGRSALQKLLHAAYKRGDTSVEVRVRRPAQAQQQQQLEMDSSGELVSPGSEASVETTTTTTRMQACIVPQEAATGGGGGIVGMGMVGRSSRHYVLRSIRDPNYAVGLVDRMESECVAFRGSRSSRVVCALSKAQLQDGYVSYPWEKKMREVLPVPNSSSFLSILVLPTALDRAKTRYNSVDDTLARANAWFLSSQASGVPIAFLNVQTEALLTKISGDMASATVNSGSVADLPNLANASLYGFEDYHGVDIGVVKAVRIWFTAAAGEMPVEITLEEGDTKLGFAISRTEEGFLYISSVMEDDDDLPAPSTRSGIRDLYRAAKRASKLLVISRVSCRKVLPIRSRSSRVVCALSKAQLQDGYVSYPWEKKMREVLPVPNSSSFLSILVLPTALDRAKTRYNSVDDTLARANAWFLSSQASGVPIAFLNVQTEALLTKISGDMASATVNSGSVADLPNLANASLYGFEDYHGVDIGVVKAVRIWFTAAAGEMPVEITLEEGDTKLGFAISRTEEGFLYISSVMEDDDDLPAPSTRSGIRDLYRAAKRASKLLVISRVSCRKVLPWMVSTSGAIRCFDTVSVSQKLSLHRHALRPILLHVLMWDSNTGAPARPQGEPPCPTPQPSPAFAEVLRQNSFAWVDDQPAQAEGESGLVQGRDTAGDASFRFHNFSLPNNWV